MYLNLQDLDIELEYRSSRNNVVTDFYIPVLERATEYNRAVGFFSSTALVEISKGLGQLVENGGRINLIASPKLSEEDIYAIEYGYKAKESVINTALLRSFAEPEDIFQEKRLNLLAYLVAIDKLRIKIAYLKNKNNIGIFHEKLGIIKDNNENVIAFSGSANESGMAFNYNYEAIDVFCNWKSDESFLRCQKKMSAFDKIWNNHEVGVEVIEFPDALKEKLETYNIGPIKENIDVKEGISKRRKLEPAIPEFIHLFDYQKEAISKWTESNYVGIYDMATGTGKTYTGLASIINLYKKLGRLAVVIMCPYLHLVEQWIEDIKIFNIPYIVGNSSYKNYKENLKDAIFRYNLEMDNMVCFICTNDTFMNNQVQNILEKIKGDILLVADEAHNLGAKKIQNKLNDRYKYRLALSATIDRYGDPEGTSFLYSYFGDKCIEYTLSRAIQEHKLTPYKYYPIIVSLTDDELMSYREFTYEIGKCIIIDKHGKKRLSEKGKKLAIARARLVAGAANKIEMLETLMQEYRAKNHILVYCGATRLFEDEDDEIGKRQIELVTELLGEKMKMRVARFTSDENVETRACLKSDFENGEDLQALIAIRCLDEGVNIPGIRTAFILASSSNPKEYIQRRGRVLRKCNGKEYAEIYDFVTIPRSLSEIADLPDDEKQKDMSLLCRELRRVREFGNDAMNFLDTERLIHQIESEYECTISTFYEGEEEDV